MWKNATVIQRAINWQTKQTPEKIETRLRMEFNSLNVQKKNMNNTLAAQGKWEKRTDAMESETFHLRTYRLNKKKKRIVY